MKRQNTEQANQKRRATKICRIRQQLSKMEMGRTHHEKITSQMNPRIDNIGTQDRL